MYEVMAKIKQALKQCLPFLYSHNRLYSVESVSFKTIEKQNISDKNSVGNELSESPYYFENGLRKVYPFYYNHVTYCKGRWIKRKLIDVYYQEFALYPREVYVNRITRGVVTVNNKVVDLDYVLKNKDLVSAVVHRHELAVLACPIKIIFEDEDLLVVDKPPSIPVHPCGLYRQNSILHILANDYNFHDLKVIHRLDRLTSGVLLLTKSSEKSREIHDQMNLRSINKEYVCRVEGNFPDDLIVCNKPIKQFYNKVGASLVHPCGKLCVTEFKKLSYNGKSSVVVCKPLTGRTHQIRVHLQYLGHPVINDPLYNSYAFGPEKGKGGVISKSIEQLLEDLLAEHSSEWGLGNIHCKEMIQNESTEKNNSIFKEYYNMNGNLPRHEKNESRITYDDDCYFCKLPNCDPEQNRLGLFLHASKYQGVGWEFNADMPFWALEDWNVF